MRMRFAFILAATGVILCAALSCTPLPDLDDDPIVSLPDLSGVDAAGCEVDALPPELCARLGTR